jgi:hypothetical protein
LFLRAIFVTRLRALGASTRRLALGRFRALGGLLVGRFWFRLSGPAERGLEIEVGAEIVLGGGTRRPSALGTGRTSRATLGPSRFVSPRSLGFFSVGSGPRGFNRRLTGALSPGGRGSWLVEQQVLGRDLGVRSRVGTKVDAEQILGQSLPRVFLAARAGAQRIGVHKSVDHDRQANARPVTSKKSSENRRAGKALAEK